MRPDFPFHCIQSCILILCSAAGVWADEALQDKFPVFASPLAGTSDSLYATVSRRMQSTAVVRSRFEQTKILKVLEKPVVSQGTFLFASKKGVHWQLTRPHQSTFTITETSVVQKNPQEKPRVFKLKDRPDIQGLMTAVFALASDKDKAVKKQFKVYMSGPEDSWTIGLLPRKPRMKKFLQCIVLKGSRAIDRIIIAENSGDLTEIRFFDHDFQPPELTEKEAELFDSVEDK